MSLQGQTVLVTGATGFLGGALALRLAAEGVQVKALARSLHKTHFLRSSPHSEHITIVNGDITCLDRIQHITEDCHTVFHAAAATGGSWPLQRQANIEGTRNVMRAAAASGALRVVHISSVAVYGYAQRDTVTEAAGLSPGADAYSISKAQAESVVREFAGQPDMPFTIIRPGAIYGPRAHYWTGRFFKLATRPAIPIIGDGGGTLPAIFIDDLLDLIILAATHAAAADETFNAVSDPAPTLREYLTAYARLAGRETPAWLSIGPQFARAMAHLAARLASPYSRAKDAPALVDLATRPTVYKIDKARDRLGWEPQIGLVTGVASCAPWLRAEGLLSS